MSEASEAFADAMSICCVEDCRRLPVRMVYELEEGGVIGIAVLCRQHSASYQPTNKVLADQLLPTAQLEPEVLDVQLEV